MNIIFMRHGQATDNAKEIISDKEVYWSTLTKSGTKTILNSIKHISKNIDKIYVSPLPRTLETAYFVSKTFPKAEIIIEKRIREIDSGKYSGQKNNFELLHWIVINMVITAIVVANKIQLAKTILIHH